MTALWIPKRSPHHHTSPSQFFINSFSSVKGMWHTCHSHWFLSKTIKAHILVEVCPRGTMPLSRIPLWKIMHLWFWSTCMQLMMASTQESQAQVSISMSYERVSYIILTTVFVSVNPACGASNTLGGGGYHFSNLPVRREKRELHFLKKLYTPYDVIPIRKP